MSDTTVTPGQTIQVSARRFRDSVIFRLAGRSAPVGTVSADEGGIARLTFEVPAVAVGPSRLDAVGTAAEGGTLTLTAQLRVLSTDDGLRGVGSRHASGERVGSVPTLRMTLVMTAVALGLAIGVVRRRQKRLY